MLCVIKGAQVNNLWSIGNKQQLF